MKVPPHVLRLYVKTARRYKKIFAKLHRETVSAYERKTFLHKLKKLLRTLRELEAQLKIAAATGTIVLMLNANAAKAQTSEQTAALGPFVKQNRVTNPLREPIFTGYEPNITVVDWDKDNDYDVVVGEYHYNGGHLRFFENQSSSGHPLYIEKIDEENPFEDIHALTRKVVPVFADIDKDGDLDLILGQSGYDVAYQYPYDNTRGIQYFRNDNGTFNEQTDTWNSATKEGNPFAGLEFGSNVSPVIVDFDADSDLDLIVGSFVSDAAPPYYGKFIHYYVNDGAGNFTASSLTVNTPLSWSYNDPVFPALHDLDGDGDLDMLVGNYYDGFVRYYIQDTPGNFVEQQQEWDPVAKTGNPFDNFEVGRNASVAFIDFNKDGKMDVFVADEEGYYGSKYSDNIINYYENSGNSVFNQKSEFENPFDGVNVKEAAAPLVMDVDDDGDLDAVIGNKYQRSYYDYNLLQYVTLNSYLTYYINTGGQFKRATDEENPFDGLEVYGNFTPQFVDGDGDNDLDIISGNYPGDVDFFRKEGDEFIHDLDLSPFNGLNNGYYGMVQLVDLNDDGKPEVFMTNYSGEIRYFENSGTLAAPVYTEIVDENPLTLANTYTWGTPYLRFADVDHDGDLDVLFNGTSPYDVETRALVMMENTGRPDAPVFDDVNGTIFADLVEDSRINLVDYDGDGDLDAFVGNDDGTVSYLQNENTNVAATLAETVIEYENGSDPVAVAPELDLVDEDNDYIVQATVTIENYLPGEVLAFTTHPDLTGAFDAGTGVLTFRGKTTLDDYAEVLQTVTFQANYQGRRKDSSAEIIASKKISFAVFDQDFTNPKIASKTVEVIETPEPAGIIVFNAVAPNSTGDNRFMRIFGLPSNHKVTIFSRWGDKVYDTDSYDPEGIGNAFRGKNNNGKMLPSGTYFYTIEVPGEKLISGYLTLKQ